MRPGCWMLQHGRASVFRHHLLQLHICTCATTYYLCLQMHFSFLLYKQHRGITPLGRRLWCVGWVRLCSCHRLYGSAAASQENKSVCDWQQRLTEARIDVLFIRILPNPVQMKYSMYGMSHKQAVSGCGRRSEYESRGEGSVTIKPMWDSSLLSLNVRYMHA